MKNLKYLFLLFLAIGLVTCNDYLDINTNPNQPEKPGDLDLLLADMTATYGLQPRRWRQLVAVCCPVDAAHCQQRGTTI